MSINKGQLQDSTGVILHPETDSGQVLVGASTLDNTLTTLAPLVSPVLTGVPQAPTATAGTNTTQIATTAFVASAISSSTSDNADKLDGQHGSYYAPITNPTFTGTVTTPSLVLTGDIVNDGNERHFRATGTNINWGFYINGGQFGGYDWQNSRSVFQYLPSTNALNLMVNGGSVATQKNTLDDGSGNTILSGNLSVGKSIQLNAATTPKTSIGLFSPNYDTWQEYMSNAGSGQAINGTTSQQHGYVTSWARRSFIENSPGYGWIWESAKDKTSNSGVSSSPLPMMSLDSTNGNLAVRGTITIPVATGTAPLTVASTTLVTNLNADKVDGMDATSSNTASTVVARDSSGNFSAGTITASLNGNSVATSMVDLRNSIKPSNIPSRTTQMFLSSLGGITGTANDSVYQDVLAFNGWTDTTAGRLNLLAFDKTSKIIRHYQGTYGDSTSGAWGTAKTLAYAEDVLPLTGGTILGTMTVASSGGINFANDGSYAWKGISGIIGDSDYWRVGGGATASDGGYMEIATADNATEPIYIRQYNGTFSSGTIARTLTLLDANGDTSIPGGMIVGNTNGPFILSKNGCPTNPNRSYGALGQWYEGLGVQGTKNYNTTSNFVFSVLTNDQNQLLNVYNNAKVSTRNNTLDTGTGDMMIGGLFTTNVALEVGPVAMSATPYIDFHSSGNNIDYDSRIIASGGNTSTGQGILNVQSQYFQANNYNILRALSGGYKIQSGSGAVTYGTANSQISTSITFPIAYSGTPLFFCGYGGGLPASSAINVFSDVSTNVTSTGAQLNVIATTTGTAKFWWVAIGS